HWGKADGIKYLNGLGSKIENRQPIVGERGVNANPPEDQYFKGALMLNTLRSVVNNDAKWFALIHGFYQRFKYQNIMTGDVIRYFNQQTGMDLTPFFRQYLFHAQIPVLELLFQPSQHTVSYKWQAEEPGFAMPIRAGAPAHWQTLHPTLQWQTMKTPLTKDEFQVPTDLYYVYVDKQ
ncbi:MAG: M1 family peptidase, partial [Acidobacteriaceae bacterium]